MMRIAIMTALLLAGVASIGTGIAQTGIFGDNLVIEANPAVEPGDSVITFQNAGDQKPTVTVFADGRVEYTGTLDEASKAFWESVGTRAPCAMKEGSK